MLRRQRVVLLARVALRSHLRHSTTAPAPPLAAQTSEFLYELPPELIAVHPAEPRGSSRLLVHVPAQPSAEQFAREVTSSAAAAASVTALPQGGATYDLTFAALPTVLPPSCLSKVATWWRRSSAARPLQADPPGSGLLHALESRAQAAQIAMRGCGATVSACQGLSSRTLTTQAERPPRLQPVARLRRARARLQDQFRRHACHTRCARRARRRHQRR